MIATTAARRCVLDTNVVVAGLLWNGAPRQLLGLALEKRLRLYSSPILLDELRLFQICPTHRAGIVFH